MTSDYYQRVRWRHVSGDDPVALWAHVVDGWEVRKVDEFADGHLVWADGGRGSGSTRLSEVPMPTAREIAGDSQFAIEIVDATVFDRVWQRALASS
ncbi:DUF6881 domain-containing protein [Paraoerskovia marina]|uniref:DUF6881 domain-containing protein n=1 Tax=Paraoerskovia marina TaxID=545619 RepID=UPI0004928D54|nr:hypothetical protein [Paraoerskovia marina]